MPEGEAKNGSDYKVERFGPYEVHQRLGLGGMATVHLAMERGVAGFERWVALKRLLPHLSEDDEFIRSFVREAQLASRLSHPNVVKINQLGKVGEDYFISMEYIEGRDVRALLRRARKVAGPPPLTVIASLLLELLDALDYAHRKKDENGRPLGLVHRDISPSNLLVNVNGHLKIIDFGIAKATAEQSRTQTGKIKGKLAYISPEVLRGKPPDARSDLFSVGIIAHELLTARPLFASKNDYKTIQRIQNAEVLPPSSLNTNCPAELDEWVLKGLTKRRSERWSSARDMLDALGKIIHDFHLHATSRDVASWVEWAFSLPLPERGKQRPTRGPAPRAPSIGDAEEELLDIIWGTHGGPRAPLKLDEIAARIGESRDLELETDPAAAAPTSLLFPIGADLGASQPAGASPSIDETWNLLMGEIGGIEVAAEEAVESTEPNGLVGPGDAAAFGTIDLGAEDWLTDAPIAKHESALFSESELTALSPPLGGLRDVETVPATRRPRTHKRLVDVAPEKGDFDDTEPQENAIGSVLLPPPVVSGPSSLAKRSSLRSSDTYPTTVRPVGVARKRRTLKEAAAEASGDVTAPAAESGDETAPAAESGDETVVAEAQEPTRIESPPSASAPADEVVESAPAAAAAALAGAEPNGAKKKTTLRGLPTTAKPPNPLDVVLLDSKKTKKRITARTTVPPLPEPEEPSVTVTRAALSEAAPAPRASPIAQTVVSLDVPVPPTDETRARSVAESSTPPPAEIRRDAAPPVESSWARPPSSGGRLGSTGAGAPSPLSGAGGVRSDGAAPTVTELAPARGVALLIVLAIASLLGSGIAYFVMRDGGDEPSSDAVGGEVARDAGVGVDGGAIAKEVDDSGRATELTLPDAGIVEPRDGGSSAQPTDRPRKREGAPVEVSGSGHPKIVRVYICIDRQGQVQSSRVLDPVAESISRAISAAVSAWAFEPYRRDHKPVKACFEELVPISAAP